MALLTNLPPESLLEWYTARTLEENGYDVQPKTLEELGKVLIKGEDRDRQVDVYAKKKEIFRIENILVECKCHQNKIQVKEAEVFSTSVREIRGSLEGNVQGLFVSLSELTDTARTHLKKQGIEIIEGRNLKNFLGDVAYQKISNSMVDIKSHQEFYGRVLYPSDKIQDIIKIHNSSSISFDKIKGTYQPVLCCQVEVSCRRNISSAKTPMEYNKQVMFLSSFDGDKPRIYENIDGLAVEKLKREEKNLSNTPSEGIIKPDWDIDPSDPLIYSLLIAEASRRTSSQAFYSDLLKGWAIENKQDLQKRTLEEISNLEESEIENRKQRDEDRLFDLDQKINEAEADLDMYRTEIYELQYIEDSARQKRHLAGLKAKASASEKRLQGYVNAKSKLIERCSKEIDTIRTKYDKRRENAIQEFTIRPTPEELSLDIYLVWLPVFQTNTNIVIDTKETTIPVEWNGMSGAIDIGACKTCNNKIKGDDVYLCFDCLQLICRNHALKCNTCSKYLCDTDIWQCSQCAKKYCNFEEQITCNECKSAICMNCRITCSACGVILCRDHTYSCYICGKSLCISHRRTCPICNRIVCQSELVFCRGCERPVGKIHLAKCPKCGNVTCSDCVREKTTISSISKALLKGKIKETRCVFCESS